MSFDLGWIVILTTFLFEKLMNYNNIIFVNTILIAFNKTYQNVINMYSACFMQVSNYVKQFLPYNL